ncbi:MAG: EAL domain-containing protein, partial [Planctomycetales bacterium]|nr:EAL domain-containing protein [Planctomycetales bacterium]
LSANISENLSGSTTAESPVSQAAMWFLAGPLLGNHSVRHVPISVAPFVVGRRSDVNLTLPSLTVSSRHAELTPQDDVLLVRDLGSTNGTFVNAVRISGEAYLKPNDLLQFADMPFRLVRQSTLRNTSTISHDVLDQALALVQFEALMNQEAVLPHYQPIVDIRTREVLAYEVLARSRLVGLETPKAMFSAAAALDLEAALSRMLRIKGVEHCRKYKLAPHLFVNTHPAELRQPELLESMQKVREVAPNQEITLEIHEATAVDVATLKELRDNLRDLDVRFAFDDFGAGQSRLVELLEVHPDYVKFDMSLVRNIDSTSPEHRRMIAALVKMVCDIGVVPLAEGVETEAESAACLDLGFVLAQGFLYGRPSPIDGGAGGSIAV